MSTPTVDPEEERRARFVSEQQGLVRARVSDEVDHPRPVPGRDLWITLTPTWDQWRHGWTHSSPMGHQRIQLPPEMDPGSHDLGPYGGHGRWGGERGRLWVELQLPERATRRALRRLATEQRELGRLLARSLRVGVRAVLLLYIVALIAVGVGAVAAVQFSA